MIMEVSHGRHSAHYDYGIKEVDKDFTKADLYEPL